MKSSIAMCTYNGEKYLKSQLESIASQTVLPYELVVCDDCSNDGTLDILRDFAKVSPIEVKISQNDKNLGSTKNFEKAINLCSGEIIFCADQDDVWDSEKIALTLKKFAESEKVGMVFTDAHVVDSTLNPLGFDLWEAVNFKKNGKRQVLSGNAFTVLMNHNVVTGATMAFRREMRDIFNPIPSEWVHDFWIAIVASCVSDVAFVDQKLMKYRQHGSQQIGVELHKHGGLNAKGAFRNNSEFYKERQKHYDTIYQKLLLIRSNLKDETYLAYVEGKTKHLDRRANLPSEGLKRLKIVLEELLSLRYHKFSNGFVSAAKDAILMELKL